MFQNIPQVTKNILILNIVFFVATFFLEAQEINLTSQFGAHYVNSPLFQPFQIVTHFFMHGGLLHIFFNMWLFVMLGGYLERIWGPKRFFIFYVSCAIGAFALYNAIGVYEIELLKEELISLGYNIEDVNAMIAEGNYLKFDYENNPAYHNYVVKSFTPMVGASGAVFGVMAAFAILFPNTEFMLYFTIPVKAKYLVGIYFLIEVFLAYQNNAGDNTAHLAHVGGAIVGGIIVLFWRKSDRTNFW
jgi:membrane associated rhomboid family serine protease